MIQIIKPLVISSPRVGSSLLTHMLYLLAKKNWNFQSKIGEYFSNYRISGDAKHTYLDYYYIIENDQRLVKKTRDQNYCDEIALSTRQHRLEILKTLPDVHMIKAHAADIDDNIINFFIDRKYTFFFLQRRNKLQQFLSYLSSLHQDQWVFKVGDIPRGAMIYKKELFDQFCRFLIAFQQLRQKNIVGSIDINYEEFIKLGGNQSAVLTLSGINADLNDSEEHWPFVETVYQDHKQNLVVNQDEFQKDLPTILKILGEFD